MKRSLDRFGPCRLTSALVENTARHTGTQPISQNAGRGVDEPFDGLTRALVVIAGCGSLKTHGGAFVVIAGCGFNELVVGSSKNKKHR